MMRVVMNQELVSWSLTSLFSTNMAISETKDDDESREILTTLPGTLFSTVCQTDVSISCSATSNDSTAHPPLSHESIARLTNVEFTSVSIAFCAGTIGAEHTRRHKLILKYPSNEKKNN